LALFKSIIFYCITIALGALFIFSGYTKLLDIEPFEWTLAETGVIGFSAANVVARLLIALEFALGIAFIANISWPTASKWRYYVYSIAALLLLLFNAYLLWVLATYGNNTNCGCFGKYVYFTPWQAYIKNIITLLLIIVLSYWHNAHRWQSNKWVLISIAILTIAFTGIMRPPEFIYIQPKQVLDKPLPINLDPLYTDSASNKPIFNYKNSKQIIAVVSSHCIFCKKAAKRMHIIKKLMPKAPLYIVAGGHDTLAFNAFVKETNIYNVPRQLNANVQWLSALATDGLPYIAWVHNGQVVRTSNYYNLYEQDIANWLNK
jgi:uncharacterized membrane protein YphA (DoxX/SURF4 family)